MLLLRMTVDNSSSELLVKKWICFALRSKAKVLYLSLKKPYGKRFELPNIAFIGSTLVELRIQYCKISNCSFMLPTLRALFLNEVCIEDDDFKDLLAGCPRIEELDIFMCFKKLRTMVVSNPTLKFFALNSPRMGCKVLIESKNLESLKLSLFSQFMYEVVEITSPTTVRNLKLFAVNDQHMTLTHFINKFPLLEELMIYNCIELQNLYISQPNLARFKLHTNGEVEVRMDAPKLKSLNYTGGLTSFPGIEASQELESVQFDLIPGRLDDHWYIWLRNILESFTHSKHLSLICQSEQPIIFTDELTEMLLPTINDLKNLELRIRSSTATSQQILDGFSWILPGLKTLSLTLGSISKLIKFPR